MLRFNTFDFLRQCLVALLHELFIIFKEHHFLLELVDGVVSVSYGLFQLGL